MGLLPGTKHQPALMLEIGSCGKSSGVSAKNHNATLTMKGIVQNVQVSFYWPLPIISNVTRIDIYLTYMASLISKLECIGKPLGQD